jgi:hypothetical protein
LGDKRLEGGRFEKVSDTIEESGEREREEP